jgi:hypothetical protein
MWRRNCHPLPEDKPEEISQRYRELGPQYDSILFFGAPPTLRVRRHRSLHGSRQRRPHHLFGLPLPGPSSFPLTLRSWKPQAHTSIFDCIATEPRRTHRFPRSKLFQSLPRALAQVSTTAEPDQVYLQWPVSFLALAYGTDPYNDYRLLVEPEVGPLIITATQTNTHKFHFFLFSSACCITGRRTAALRRTS